MRKIILILVMIFAMSIPVYAEEATKAEVGTATEVEEEANAIVEALKEKIAELEASVSNLKGKLDVSKNETADDWINYFKTDLLPTIAGIVTAVVSMLFVLLTTWTKIKQLIDKFGKATEDVHKATENVETNDKLVAELQAKMEEMNDRMDKYAELVQSTNEIARIGFCNMTELVEKGYADEIKKVVIKDEICKG